MVWAKSLSGGVLALVMTIVAPNVSPTVAVVGSPMPVP